MDPTTRHSAQRWTSERITTVQRWAPHQWSLRIARPADFRFQPGHYAKLGLALPDGQEVWRPYSIVSAPTEDELEFLLTLVPGGALTPALDALGVGDEVRFEHLAMGFFIETQLAAGERLWMLATGSGLGPYVSMLRDGSALARHGQIVLVHSVRYANELAYADEFRALAERLAGRLHYVPVVTREPQAGGLSRRIPAMIEDGALEAHVGMPMDAQGSRVMVCGNPDFTTEMRRILNGRSFVPCRRGLSGSMLFEKYW